jgi:hypothetical protein
MVRWIALSVQKVGLSQQSRHEPLLRALIRGSCPSKRLACERQLKHDDVVVSGNHVLMSVAPRGWHNRMIN